MISNFRKYRINQETRDLYAETRLFQNDYIIPYFIVGGSKIKNEINSFPGVFHLSVDMLLHDLEELVVSGYNKILLFGVPENSDKDEKGSNAYHKNNLVSSAVTAVKKQFPGILVITDVCLCAYTSHGHCGILRDKIIDNDSSLEYLAKMAVAHAGSGADFVAPSAMMDGQVHAIRKGLDTAGFINTKILGYSAKYASAFYGPFRDAAHSAPSFGDRRTYQMDYRNSKQAIAEIKADIEEGADMVMVKPAHAYLDIISKAVFNFPEVPVVAYHVSGEYSMIKLAAQNGLLDESTAFREIHTAIKRSGAKYIITYFHPSLEFFK